MGDHLGIADLVGVFPFFPYFSPHPLLSLLTLPQRAQFDVLNLKFLNSSQIYAPTLIYWINVLNKPVAI